MKKTLFAALLAAALMFSARPASAHDYDRDDSDYPLRYIAYVVHPIGVAVEYAILRPIHWIVSRDAVNEIFGHYPNATEPEEEYFRWE